MSGRVQLKREEVRNRGSRKGGLDSEILGRAQRDATSSLLEKKFKASFD